MTDEINFLLTIVWPPIRALDHTTNGIAISLVIYGVLNAGVNWSLVVACISSVCTPDGKVELVKLIGAAIGALLMYYTGKFPFLKAWLPTVDDVVKEVEKDVEQQGSEG